MFRPWVLDFAVSAAWADRELSPWEQGALRDYNMDRVRGWRDAEAEPRGAPDRGGGK